MIVLHWSSTTIVNPTRKSPDLKRHGERLLESEETNSPGDLAPPILESARQGQIGSCQNRWSGVQTLIV